jgi:hypothetical protein
MLRQPWRGERLCAIFRQSLSNILSFEGDAGRRFTCRTRVISSLVRALRCSALVTLSCAFAFDLVALFKRFRGSVDALLNSTTSLTSLLNLRVATFVQVQVWRLPTIAFTLNLQ